MIVNRLTTFILDFSFHHQTKDIAENEYYQGLSENSKRRNSERTPQILNEGFSSPISDKEIGVCNKTNIQQPRRPSSFSPVAYKDRFENHRKDYYGGRYRPYGQQYELIRPIVRYPNTNQAMFSDEGSYRSKFYQSNENRTDSYLETGRRSSESKNQIDNISVLEHRRYSSDEQYRKDFFLNNKNYIGEKDYKQIMKYHSLASPKQPILNSSTGEFEKFRHVIIGEQVSRLNEISNISPFPTSLGDSESYTSTILNTKVQGEPIHSTSALRSEPREDISYSSPGSTSKSREEIIYPVSGSRLREETKYTAPLLTEKLLEEPTAYSKSDYHDEIHQHTGKPITSPASSQSQAISSSENSSIMETSSLFSQLMNTEHIISPSHT